jgi:cytochrome c2
MTFILGLVAEPVPAQFVHKPTGDKLAEVAGRKVLDKFNCAGCHIVRPGSIDFKPVDLKRFDGHPNVRKQEVPYTGDDYVFPEDIAWTGHQPANPDKVTVHGVTPPIEVKFGEEEEPSKDAKVWLMQAFHYHKDNQKDGKARDIPAGATLFIPPEWLLSPDPNDPNKFTAPQFGGAFTHLVAEYLQRKDRENFGGQAKMSNAYAAAPPVLIGEGQKVQPEWLYKFLLNPYPIRPLTVLRMPKFNMSPDEAQKLVNYFGAVDKTTNVGIGLTYPYVPMPEKQESYLLQKTQEYVARLKAENQYDARKKELQAFWERQLAAEKADAEKKLAEAQERLKAAPAAAKADAQKQADEAKKLADDLKAKLSKKDVSQFVKQWEEREAYVADAGRLVGHGNVCLTCHHAAGLDGKENKGPNLDGVAERLRPDWMERWITNPSRFLHYSSLMPINFKATARENQDAFVGSSKEQIQAARDFLFLYPQIREWPVLRARPILGLTTPATPPMGGK